MKLSSRRRFLADLSIDSGEIVSGLPLGTVIVGLPTTGPSCVGSSDH